MASSTTSYLSITSPNIFGFILSRVNLRFLTFSNVINPLLRIILTNELPLSTLIMEVSILHSKPSFQKLESLTSQHPPHTPELNGYSERRHRHIVETGLALLTHASLPLSFWPQAFSTAVYLINRMPTKTLQFSSPFELIFQTAPNYSKLKSFGCLCYPWLHPYSSHKLEPKSKPCVFIGYSLSQSAYLCFEPKTSKTYASRHVKFVETIFPYTSLISMSPCPSHLPAVSWFPPVLTVSMPLPA